MWSTIAQVAVLGGLATTVQATCYSGVKVILARGTFEPQNSSLAELPGKAIVAKIPDSNLTEVIYPASTDFGPSVAAGILDAQRQIYDYAAACPTGKIVIMGYSQGAQVMGNVLWGGGSVTPDGSTTAVNSPICPTVAKQIIAVIQFGDPGRVYGIGFDADITGPACNVSGPLPRTGYEKGNMTLYADRLAEWCNYSDYVCCATGTTFAGHISYYTDDNAATIAQYVADKAANANLRPRSRPSNLPSNATSSQLACGGAGNDRSSASSASLSKASTKAASKTRGLTSRPVIVSTSSPAASVVTSSVVTSRVASGPSPGRSSTGRAGSSAGSVGVTSAETSRPTTTCIYRGLEDYVAS